MDGKYVRACANTGNGNPQPANEYGGGGAVFCMRCGCSWCYGCSPGIVSCSRYDGGEDMCGKKICADCAWDGDGGRAPHILLHTSISTRCEPSFISSSSNAL